MRVQSTAEGRRIWGALTNTETGTTLDLEPGEIADTEFPEGFEDPYLKVLKPARKDAEKAPTTNQQEDPK